jgi:predicted DCC family thiol-disulfide oxidoreductase YuxK
MKNGTAHKGEKPAVLIYDGACPICRGTVSWLRENEVADSFDMVPCQSDERAGRFPGIEPGACMRAMHLVLPDGKVLIGEQALPKIVARLKGYRVAAFLFALPGAGALSRIAYRWFAERRYRIASILSHLPSNRKRTA